MTSVKFIDGNSGNVLSDVPFDELPDSIRYLSFRGGVLVNDPAEADEQVPVVKIVRFTFDREGKLAPPERAYNGFLKFFDASGSQIKESFIVYAPDATLEASNLEL